MFDAYVCKETSDKNKRKKQDQKNTGKTLEKQDAIREYLQQNGSSKTSAIAEYIGLSPARTRNILVNMKDVVAEGANKNRKYHLFDESGLVRK